MKNEIGLIALVVFSVFSSGAFAADKAPKEKDIKTTVEELNYKYEKLLQLDYERHQQVMRELKELRAMEKKKPEAPSAVTSTPVPTMEPTAIPAAAPEAVVATPTPVSPPISPITAAAPVAEAAQPVVEVPQAALPPPAPPVSLPEPTAGVTTPSTTEAPASHAAEPAASVVEVTGREVVETEKTSPAAIQPPAPIVTAVPIVMPQPIIISEARPSAKVVVPTELKEGMRTSRTLSILALLVSFISLLSMAVLILTIRKSDERIRRMLWKSEVDHLRDEVIGGRPHLKVEKSFDRLLLTNTGTVAADEIKLSLGPAPATMKQRLRVLEKILASEKAEVEIGPQAVDGQLYGTLEYKNPDNGRTYKEQFVLRVDGVTGELVPVSQAS